MTGTADEYLKGEVAGILKLMEQTGYPAGPFDEVSKDHCALGALDLDYGINVETWLTTMQDRRRMQIVNVLMGEVEVIARAKAQHPAASPADRSSSTAPSPPPIIDSVPGPASPASTPVNRQPIIDTVPTVPERTARTASAVAEIDSMITDMSGRTLVPTSEFIDRLLDLRLAFDADAA